MNSHGPVATPLRYTPNRFLFTVDVEQTTTSRYRGRDRIGLTWGGGGQSTSNRPTALVKKISETK